MTFAFGHHDSDMGEHLVDYSDGTPKVLCCQSDKIASNYKPIDWDEELFRKSVDELVDLCPAFKSVLESQYYADEVHCYHGGLGSETVKVPSLPASVTPRFRHREYRSSSNNDSLPPAPSSASPFALCV